jgi:hypothetical protein
VKRFSQFDVCNRALLDRKVFEDLRRPVGLGAIARRKRKWQVASILSWRWVRMLVFATVVTCLLLLAMTLATSPQTVSFLSRVVVIGAYLFALFFLLMPPDARLVTMSRRGTHAARIGDAPVVRARRDAWVGMLRDTSDSPRKARWSRHPHVNGVMMVGFVTGFSMAILGDALRGVTNAVPFGRVGLALAFPVCMWGTFGVMHWYSRRMRRQLADRIEQALCCDCAYQLDRGMDGLGPKRCLECGCPWPLVPPELPPSPKATRFFQLPAWML